MVMMMQSESFQSSHIRPSLTTKSFAVTELLSLSDPEQMDSEINNWIFNNRIYKVIYNMIIT